MLYVCSGELLPERRGPADVEAADRLRAERRHRDGLRPAAEHVLLVLRAGLHRRGKRTDEHRVPAEHLATPPAVLPAQSPGREDGARDRQGLLRRDHHHRRRGDARRIHCMLSVSTAFIIISSFLFPLSSFLFPSS